MSPARPPRPAFPERTISSALHSIELKILDPRAWRRRQAIIRVNGWHDGAFRRMHFLPCNPRTVTRRAERRDNQPKRKSRVFHTASPVDRTAATRQAKVNIDTTNPSVTRTQSQAGGRFAVAAARSSGVASRYNIYLNSATQYVSGLKRMTQPIQLFPGGANAPDSSHMGSKNTIMMA